MKTKHVHISEIVPGDTIMHNGKPMTVCATDIKSSHFMGRSIFGDTYALGNRPVLLVEDVANV